MLYMYMYNVHGIRHTIIRVQQFWCKVIMVLDIMQGYKNIPKLTRTRIRGRIWGNSKCKLDKINLYKTSLLIWRSPVQIPFSTLIYDHPNINIIRGNGLSHSHLGWGSNPTHQTLACSRCFHQDTGLHYQGR